MLTVQIDFDELLKVIDQLTDEQKRILEEHLQENAAQPATGKKPRVLGLHPGAFQPSDDFDAPLIAGG
jgi:hypothetical protein